MSLFCLLWTPLFYLFWISLSPPKPGNYTGLWAFLLGSLAALLQFLIGDFVHSGGFGISRWFSACIDIIGLPAVLPFLVSGLFLALKAAPVPADLGAFALLWLIPGGAVRAVTWNGGSVSLLLALSPLLWTALALGLAFFLGIVQKGTLPVKVAAVSAMAALFFSAATAYWAFFSQRYFLGFLLLFASLIPMAVAIRTRWQKTASPE